MPWSAWVGAAAVREEQRRQRRDERRLIGPPEVLLGSGGRRGPPPGGLPGYRAVRRPGSREHPEGRRPRRRPQGVRAQAVPGEQQLGRVLPRALAYAVIGEPLHHAQRPLPGLRVQAGVAEAVVGEVEHGVRHLADVQFGHRHAVGARQHAAGVQLLVRGQFVFEAREFGVEPGSQVEVGRLAARPQIAVGGQPVEHAALGVGDGSGRCQGSPDQTERPCAAGGMGDEAREVRPPPGVFHHREYGLQGEVVRRGLPPAAAEQRELQEGLHPRRHGQFGAAGGVETARVEPQPPSRTRGQGRDGLLGGGRPAVRVRA